MPVGKGTHRAAGKRVLAGLAVVGIMVVSGLMAAWGVSPGETRPMSPAQVVAHRFPAHWKDGEATTGAAPRLATYASATYAPATYALASVAPARADDSAFLFDPHPTWPVSIAAVAAEPAPTIAATLAREPKADIKPEPKPAPTVAATTTASEPKAEAKAEPKSAHAKPVVVASRSLAPAHHPHPPKDSAMLFNEAQLAGIKARLKLSDYQEQYWPAVAAALHALGERAAREPVRVASASAYAGEGPLAGIDPDGPEVQQLKSAAFPLIMSMSYEQKDQVRSLARMMGLEQVASSF